MKKLFIIFLLLTAAAAHAADLSRKERNAIYPMIEKIFKDRTSLTANTVTKSGAVHSCEILFEFTYRDYKSQDGAPVFVTGSITYMYMPQNWPGMLVKIVPTRIDAKRDANGKVAPDLRELKPTYVSLAGKGDFSDTRTQTFEGENGGLMTGYQDRELKVSQAVSDLTKVSVTFNTVQDGTDHHFKFSDTYDEVTIAKVSAQFLSCQADILERAADSLE